jgi:hypothetical protein
MKKIFPIFSLLLLIIATLLSVSCASTPDKGVLTEPMAKAQAARQRAMDFESPAYFPSDWENLEAQYAAAGEMPLTSNATVQLAVAAYNALATAYDELFGRTIPLYAQAREDEIISAREALTHTDFIACFPEYLRKADNLALAAHAQYEAQDYYAARDSAVAALSEYELLLMGAAVYTVRQEIMDRGFIDYDRDNFLRADEIVMAAIESYEADNNEEAKTGAEEALLRYNIVLAIGWTSYSAERKVSASSERELALTERVAIASREHFREAEAIFNQAEAELAAENFPEAALHFIDAEARYAIARQDTEVRRQRAEAAIRMAEDRIEESSEAAQEAERIIEGGIR